MATFDEERDRNTHLPTGQAAPPSPPGEPEPPFLPIFPNLDRVSRDSLKRGTFSRRRIVRAAIGFLIVVITIVVIVWLTGPSG